MRKIFLSILLFFSLTAFSQFKAVKITGTVFDLDSYVIVTKNIDSALLFIKQFDSTVVIEDLDGRGALFAQYGYSPVLWIPTIPETIEDFSILNHEIFHLISAILKWAGVSLSDETNEIYAYMTQYYSKIIYLSLR